MKLVAIILALTACSDVEQTVDYALPANLQLGHTWSCELELALGYPDVVSVRVYTYKPCRAPGPIDPFLDWWVKDVCFPDGQAAQDAGQSPGGWNCGGDGCTPNNYDVCEVPQDGGP